MTEKLQPILSANTQRLVTIVRFDLARMPRDHAGDH